MDAPPGIVPTDPIVAVDPTVATEPTAAVAPAVTALSAATPRPMLGPEVPLAVLGAVTIGLVVVSRVDLVGRLGVLRRLGPTSTAGAVERAVEAPETCGEDELSAVVDALAAHAGGRPTRDDSGPTIDPDRLRTAINSLRAGNLDLLTGAVERLRPHLTHEVTPIRIAVSFALATVAREDPDRVATLAEDYRHLLGDADPTVRQNAVWYFGWLAGDRAGDLGDVAVDVAGLSDDPDPDVRANVVTFFTEFCHNCPATAQAIPHLEGRLRSLATDGELQPEVREEALNAADYVKSVKLDPEVARPPVTALPAAARGAGAAAGDLAAGDEVELVVEEADYADDEPTVRGTAAGVDVELTDPPADCAPLQTVRVEVVDADAAGDGAGAVRATPVADDD